MVVDPTASFRRAESSRAIQQWSIAWFEVTIAGRHATKRRRLGVAHQHGAMGDKMRSLKAPLLAGGLVIQLALRMLHIFPFVARGQTDMISVLMIQEADH
jgi:hypothetical protein